ncbi:uncharacterized protein yc1106_06474 [Curvularia clavata]|uniref:Uncharacterized protein n=1 Tax=Curvularia clavata TaxID=95742 RepID=A0A9Q8ZBJ9_CURCL|nr:uncharacterized protein yc1106_06474 [Curvularia clavata]
MTRSQMQFDFIITDPVSNPKPGKSIQIRSRCMQGRNKREDSRRTQREKRRMAKETTAIVVPDRTLHPSMTLSPKLLTRDAIPIQFAGHGIDSEAKSLIANVFVFNFLATDVTPLERCVNLDCLESSCFSWLFMDTMFLHSILCASYASKEFKSPHWKGNPGVRTTFHLQATLSSLRVKMQETHAYQDESVLRVIINLALLAITFGDWVAGATHLEGLLEIVQLRGDAAFLKGRPTLHFKLDRTDLAWYLSTGRKPYFMQPIKSWDCRVAPNLQPPADLYQPSTAWDSRIVNVFKDFQKLSLLIGRNRLKFVINDPAICHGDLNSLQTRLLCLADIVTKPIEELVRLTMLAMLTSTFKLPGRDIPYDWVAERLRSTYITVRSEIRHDKSLLLWVVLTASITVARAHEPWIRDGWKAAAAGLTWKKVEAQLLKVMWIEIVHSKPGKKVHNQFSNVNSSS